MKKILLIPTYHYLSNPLYKALYNLLKDEYKFTYFFSKDSTMIGGNLENITYDKIGYIFDDYIELGYNAPWVERFKAQELKKIEEEIEEEIEKEIEEEIEKEIEKEIEEEIEEDGKVSILNRSLRFVKRGIRKGIRLVKRSFRYILKIILGRYRRFRRWVVKWKNQWVQLKKIKKYGILFSQIVKDINPDIIIMTSDMTISYRVVKKFFPTIQIIIIQPCFLDFREKEEKIFSKTNKIKNFLVGNILYPKQQYFGMENNKDKLLLIEDRFLEFYEKKRNNIYKVINPYYYQLNKDISQLQTSTFKKELLEKLDLNPKKKVIIIFLSDYTLIHGEEVQTYLEETYTKVINNYADTYNFIIKNHPRAGVKGYENNFKNLSDICFMQNEITYIELLSLGDLNISINSNASLEAIVSGMVTLNFLPLQLKDDEHYKWLTYYGGINISTYEEMKNFLETFEKNNHTFIKDLSSSRTKLIGEGDECKKRLLSTLHINMI